MKENGTIVTTMSKAYQITVPSVVRKMLGLEAGDEIVMEETKRGVLLKKALTREEQIKEMLAEFDELNEEHERRMTPEQKEFAKRSAGWTVNQYHEYFDNLPEADEFIKEKYGA